jgi:hypothetical protein
LIAQNVASFGPKIDNLNPLVSIINFHYATPAAATLNYGLNKVIADDETGFRGTGDLTYRTDAWNFILAGGAVYSNLDWSFTPRHPAGTFALPLKTPGGGGPELRKQLKILKDFIDGFDFVRMKPSLNVVKSVKAARGKATVQVLAEPGKAYAIYLMGGTQAELVIELPHGNYRAEWMDTKTGKVEQSEDFPHDRGNKVLKSPVYAEDISLRLILRAEKRNKGLRTDSYPLRLSLVSARVASRLVVPRIHSCGPISVPASYPSASILQVARSTSCHARVSLRWLSRKLPVFAGG